jgi:hypothetical protein
MSDVPRTKTKKWIISTDNNEVQLFDRNIILDMKAKKVTISISSLAQPFGVLFIIWNVNPYILATV